MLAKKESPGLSNRVGGRGIFTEKTVRLPHGLRLWN